MATIFCEKLTSECRSRVYKLIPYLVQVHLTNFKFAFFTLQASMSHLITHQLMMPRAIYCFHSFDWNSNKHLIKYISKQTVIDDARVLIIGLYIENIAKSNFHKFNHYLSQGILGSVQNIMYGPSRHNSNCFLVILVIVRRIVCIKTERCRRSTISKIEVCKWICNNGMPTACDGYYLFTLLSICCFHYKYYRILYTKQTTNAITANY